MNTTTNMVNPVVSPAPPTVWETVQQFPRPVWCLLAGMFINRFGTFVLPFLALHLAGLGYSAVVGGWVLGALALTWADSLQGFALAMVLVTAGEILSMPVALAYAAGLGPAAMRGRVLGLYGLTWAAAMAVGPACGSAVFALSPPALWLGCAALGFAAAAVIRPPLRPSSRVKP